jgi:hypothetical protein
MHHGPHACVPIAAQKTSAAISRMIAAAQHK